MKTGIEINRWAFCRVGDGKVIATCIAKTYFEAKSYFDEEHLILDRLYEIRVIEHSQVVDM